MLIQHMATLLHMTNFQRSCIFGPSTIDNIYKTIRKFRFCAEQTRFHETHHAMIWSSRKWLNALKSYSKPPQHFSLFLSRREGSRSLQSLTTLLPTTTIPGRLTIFFDDCLISKLKAAWVANMVGMSMQIYHRNESTNPNGTGFLAVGFEPWYYRPESSTLHLFTIIIGTVLF